MTKFCIMMHLTEKSNTDVFLNKLGHVNKYEKHCFTYGVYFLEQIYLAFPSNRENLVEY